MYVHREIEGKLNAYLRQFKVVLVTGARQTGKTTMLKHCLGDAYRYVTLDDMNAYDLAESDPAALLGSDQLPIILDEVQQVPSLFRQVKVLVDSMDAYGTVVLTGSQTYHLMQGVSESLAGRVGILEMSGFSLREILGRASGERYIPRCIKKEDVSSLPAPYGTEDNFGSAGDRENAAGNVAENVGAVGEGSNDAARGTIWDVIHRGSMPRLQDGEVDWYGYYSSYVKSYLERDVRQLISLKDERKFYNFMIAAAARTGQLLNASDIANTIDASVKTVQEWLSILQASGVIHIMQPFWANTGKKLSKTPKLFFMDTGLACHLTGWNTPEQLKRGAMAGHMFETFAVSEVLKSYLNAGRDLREVSFYRDAQKREIDLVIQDGHTLHPVEIKANVRVRRDAVKNFSCLEGVEGYEMGFGHVLCQTPEPYLLSSSVQAVPVWSV